MTKKNHIRKMRNQNRCEFSGKLIRNKPAVLVEYVIDYVRKLGYLVSNFKISSFFVVFFLFALFVSAVSSYTWWSDPSENFTLGSGHGFDNFSASHINSWLEFDGVNDRVDISSFGSLSGSQQFTISFWVNATSSQPDPSAYFLRANDDSYGFLSASLSDVRLVVKESDADYVDSGTGFSINSGEWVHLVGVYDSFVGNVSSYMNGVLNETDSVADNQTLFTLPTLHIGFEGYSSRYFNGSIDELRIYNRSLSSLEISEIYNSGRISNSTLPDEDLVLWYNFNENNGSVVYDRSGNGYDGI